MTEPDHLVMKQQLEILFRHELFVLHPAQLLFRFTVFKGIHVGVNAKIKRRPHLHVFRIYLYNRWLGQQRANAARDILVNNGVDANRLLAVSFGEDRPAIPGASLAERNKNRRVRAVPMKPVEMESYDTGLPPCAPAGADSTQSGET